MMLSVSILLAVISTFLVPPSMNYLSYIDYKTISCLFCLMVTVKGFENEGVLAAVSNGIIAKVRTTRILYLQLVLICFFSSMVITNDVALIAFVPITISVLKICGKEDKLALIVILQTIAANIGSSMTPIGNPQNLFIYSRYNMDIRSLAVTTMPYVVICGILLTVCCVARKRETINKIQTSEQIHIDFSKVVKISVLFLIALFSVVGVIPYAFALAVIFICMYMMDRGLLTKVDYGLLLTFIFIFIFVGNISSLPSVADFLQNAVDKTPV